ncbi:MAG: hypothetical protein HY809_00940 [Nitrospirae bacterium]|nr:hypothetical protein [Nitrospirota bacterium]
MKYIYIDSETGIRSYLRRFGEKGPHIIALDIEAESNLHAYGEKLCLIQIFDGVNNVIIDPFHFGTRRLKIFFEDTSVLKVMYDAGSDLSLLKNSAGIEIKSILDLRPAAELLEYEKKDLHSIIAFELGIFLEEKKKYQRYNWIKRPVAEEALLYAVNDVMHLLALKEIMLAKLYARKLLDAFLLKNLQIQNRVYTRDPEDKYRKINGYSGLDKHGKLLFKRVFDIREKYAKLFDIPAHGVIHKGDLMKIVKEPEFIYKITFPKRMNKEAVLKVLSELENAFNS